MFSLKKDVSALVSWFSKVEVSEASEVAKESIWLRMEESSLVSTELEASVIKLKNEESTVDASISMDEVESEKPLVDRPELSIASI